MPPELLDVYPTQDVIDRTSMDSWDSEGVRKAIANSNRKKLILAGLWTKVCINLCAFSALQEDYEIYVVEDECGGTSEVAHRAAMDRMVQAGVVPLTMKKSLNILIFLLLAMIGHL
jgi:nicotinamidase-related amidase